MTIIAFDFENQKSEIVFHQNVGLTRFLFLAESGNVVRYGFSSGVILVEGFTHIKFDEDWSEVPLSSLSIVYIYDLSELSDDWVERNPDVAEEGLYFYRWVHDREFITEEQFMEAFEELTGFFFLLCETRLVGCN